MTITPVSHNTRPESQLLHQTTREERTATRRDRYDVSPIPHPQLPIHIVLGIEGEDVRSNSQIGRIAAHARQKRDDHRQTLRDGGD